MTIFTTHRILQAFPSAVFAAIRDPDRLSRWWGPAGFSNVFKTFDFNPGGQWVYDMIGPDGKTYPNESVFERIEADRQVVIRHVCQPHFTLTITLEPATEGTLLTWAQDFANAAVAQAMQALVTRANEENLDRLQQEVE